MGHAAVCLGVFMRQVKVVPIRGTTEMMPPAGALTEDRIAVDAEPTSGRSV